jgi:hypothetical protein
LDGVYIAGVHGDPHKVDLTQFIVNIFNNESNILIGCWADESDFGIRLRAADGGINNSDRICHYNVSSLEIWDAIG